MDTEQQDLKKGTPIIFLPSPENKDYKHHGKKGWVNFKAVNGSGWYLELEETMFLNKGHVTKEKEIHIKVFGTPGEFQVLPKKEEESARP